MKFLILSVLVSVAAAANIPYAYIPECASLPQGQKVTYGADCKQYAICNPAGLSFVETCQDGLVYDARFDRCEWPENVPQCNYFYNNNNNNNWNNNWNMPQPWYPQQNYW